MLDHVIIFHDNTHPHIAMSVTTVFQEYGWEVLNHPLYSSDLSNPDYGVFPKLKEPLCVRFSDLNEGPFPRPPKKGGGGSSMIPNVCA